MTAASSNRLLLGGFFVGHPATGPDPHRDPALRALLAELQAAGRFSPPGVFHDLDGAVGATRLAAGSPAPQALWLPAPAVAKVRREAPGTGIDRVLDLRRSPGDEPTVAAGHDVIGLGGDLRLSFVREDLGVELCRDLGLPIDPPPFLPDAACARKLAAALNGEELGAPVLWVRCWRTVHSALDRVPEAPARP